MLVFKYTRESADEPQKSAAGEARAMKARQGMREWTPGYPAIRIQQ